MATAEIARTIAGLIQSQGEQAARAREATGAIWGGAIRDIGQNIQGAVQAATDPKLQEMRRQQAGRQALAQAIKTTPMGADGTIDHKVIVNKVSAAGFPDIGEAYLSTATKNEQNLAALDKSHRDAAKAAQDAQKQTLATIGDAAFHADTSEKFTASIGYLAAHGLLGQDAASNEKTASDILQQADSAGPDGWKAIRDQYLQHSPTWQKQQEERNKPVTLPPTPRGGSPAQQVVNGQVVATGAPANPAAPTETELAIKAAQGDPDAIAAMAKLKPTPATTNEWKDVLLDGKPAKVFVDPKTRVVTTLAGKVIENPDDHIKPVPSSTSITMEQGKSDAEAIADAIEKGDQPADIQGLYRNAGPVRAALARRGYDLRTANLDWQAAKRHVAVLNGPQQLRLNQSINALPDLLDSVEALADEWNGGHFPVLNRVNLAAAKNGLYGDKAASVATRLEAQIADVNADLGTVYMGGNTPTDHAIDLASKALKGDWSEKVLRDAIAMARKNVTIRQNSLRNTGIAGLSTQPPAAPLTPAAPPKPAAPTLTPGLKGLAGR